MPRKILVVIILAAATILFMASFIQQDRNNPDPAQIQTNPTRIISMAPSITETLFALGLGDRVIGVTRYCTYPEQAKNRSQVGGYLDPSFEAILALRPDLTILLPVQTDIQTRLNELNIKTIQVDHRTLDGILQSITTIANTCNVSQRGQTLLNDLNTKIEAIQQKTQNQTKPTVLISAGINLVSGTVQ